MVLFSLMINLVSAEEIGIPTPLEEKTPQELEFQRDYQQQDQIVSVLLPISVVISVILGIFLMIFMIRNSPKFINLILYILIFLVSIVYFISIIFDYVFNVVKFGWIVEIDFID